jgi:putative ABC transport system ATP-binding protein
MSADTPAVSIVRTEHLTRVHGKKEAAVTALRDVSLELAAGEFVAVMGPSGCGKSTLLQLIGGLDRPTSGRVLIEGQDLSALNDDRLTELRRRKIGFVFQAFILVPVLRANENAALPLVLDGVPFGQANARAEEWLARVGLEKRVNHRPDELSGGEKQRVAIARALVADPTLILADEPTGALDSRSADDLVGLLRQIADRYGRTILMVTHDPRMAAYADRIVFLKDGTVVDQTRPTDGLTPGVRA